MFVGQHGMLAICVPTCRLFVENVCRKVSARSVPVKNKIANLVLFNSLKVVNSPVHFRPSSSKCFTLIDALPDSKQLFVLGQNV